MPETRKVVYTITVVSSKEGKEVHYRDWGFYFKKEDAVKVIEENQTDISEMNYYHHALLGEKGEGPLAINEPIQWYQFVWEDGKFVRADKIECPEQYKQIYFT